MFFWIDCLHSIWVLGGSRWFCGGSEVGNLEWKVANREVLRTMQRLVVVYTKEGNMYVPRSLYIYSISE